MFGNGRGTACGVSRQLPDEPPRRVITVPCKWTAKRLGESVLLAASETHLHNLGLPFGDLWFCTHFALCREAPVMRRPAHLSGGSRSEEALPAEVQVHTGAWRTGRARGWLAAGPPSILLP